MDGINNMHTLTAGGNINPAVFLKSSTAADFTVLQAGAGERPIGVSARGAIDAQIQASSSLLVGIAGRAVGAYMMGQRTLLTIGSGGVTRGDLLKSDANGFGITTVTANDLIGAIALESASSGEMAEVLLVFGKV